MLQYCWTDVEDDVALTECRDKLWNLPHAYRADPGSRFRVRIRKAAEPKDFAIQAWPERGDEVTGPEGEPEEILFVLKPKMRDGEVIAWSAVFSLEQADRQYFIRAGGVWGDEQGADGDQDAYWLFHVKTSSA